MNSIKEEPFSENQWNQFVKNFENQPEAYFPTYEASTFDQTDVSLNFTIDKIYPEVSDQPVHSIKPEQVDLHQRFDWTFVNTAEQSFEISTDNIPNLDLDEIRSELKEIKVLYVHHALLR